MKEIATGALTSQEETAEKAYLSWSASTLKGAFAVDAGSTELLGPSLASVGLAGKIPAGGFDLTPGTLTAINAGQIDFTINQNPYCRASCRLTRCCCGWCPVSAEVTQSQPI